MTRAFHAAGLMLSLVLACVENGSAHVCVEPPEGVVGWWPADGNGDNLADGNDAVLMAGAAFAPGRVGPAFMLDGIAAYVDAGNAGSLQVSGGDFTVEAWVLFHAPSHPPGDVSILDKMSTAGINVDGWRLLKQADHRFWFCLGGVTGNRCIDPAFTLFSTTVATTGVWYHVAAVRSAAGLSLYVDGRLEDFRSPIPHFLDSHAGRLRIGSNAIEGAHLNGLIDEAAVYERALATTEIQAIVLAGAGGKCKGTSVAIDIKPDGAPNSVNPRSRGMTAVAILTTGVFDAAAVDPASVRFGHAGTEAAARHFALEDVNRDGRLDLLLHFQTVEAAIPCEATSAALMGRTFRGQAIRGTDSIRTVGCR